MGDGIDIPDLLGELPKRFDEEVTEDEFHEIMKFTDNEIPIEEVEFVEYPGDVGGYDKGEEMEEVSSFKSDILRSKAEMSELNNRFTYHPPKEGQIEVYNQLRKTIHQAAMKICELCPDSRERDIAFQKLEEAAFWANAGVARRT